MSMTEDQKQTYAAFLEASTDQTVIDALAAGNNNALVTWSNQEADPTFWVFMNSVSVDEVRRSLDWSEVLHGTTGLTELQQFGFDALLHNGTYDPSEENNREGLTKIFPVTMPNTRAAVLNDAVRHATNAEQVFAVEASGPAGGDGSAKAQAAIAEFYSSVSLQDIRDVVAIINAE